MGPPTDNFRNIVKQIFADGGDPRLIAKQIKNVAGEAYESIAYSNNAEKILNKRPSESAQGGDAKRKKSDPKQTENFFEIVMRSSENGDPVSTKVVSSRKDPMDRVKRIEKNMLDKKELRK